MKKLFAILALVLVSYTAFAQLSVSNQSPQRLFRQGKEQYQDKNYVGCIDALTQFKKQSHDVQMLTEAHFLILASEYYQGRVAAADKLKDFLEEHPETIHRNQINFFVGSGHFAKKEWKVALFWLSQADVDYLSADEQEDWSYRMAYSYLQDGNKEEARRLFGILSRISDKYREPATYYLAYIDFQNQNYAQAMSAFQRLKNSPEYAESARFMIVNVYSQQADYQNTIAEGEAYLSAFPQSTNISEVYRMLGRSYYDASHTGTTINQEYIRKSIVYYERYLQYASSPNRTDMYNLADAYYQTGVYKQAINSLQYAVGTTDQMGQAAYMLLGQSYMKLGDNNNALMAFDAAARSKVDPLISEDALYNYVVLVNKGAVTTFDQSILVFRRFLDEYPNSRYNNEINSLFANTLLSTKSYETALQAIAQIKSPGRQILMARQQITFQLGVQQFVNGDFNNAISNFTKVTQMQGYDAKLLSEAYFWRGESYYRLGRFETAASDYSTYLNQTRSAGENVNLARYGLGYTYFQRKLYTNALTNFSAYVNNERNKQLPEYADALNRIGDCYLNARNYKESERYYSQAVTLRPGNADYSEYQKAFVLGLQRDYNGKIRALNEMMAKYPNSEYVDDALFEKSRALVMLGKEREAIVILEQLLREYPQTSLGSQAGVQLGQLYFNTNNPQQSIKSYKKVIADYPGSAEARISLQSLEGVYKDINDINGYVNYANSLGAGMAVSAGRQDSLNFMAAENLFMKGQKPQAKTAFTTYIQSYPYGVFASDANYYLGTIALDNKDEQSALNHFRAVIRSNNPKYMDNALLMASQMEYGRKNYEEAYNLYSQLEATAKSVENKTTAQLGMLRSAYSLSDNDKVILAARKIQDNAKASPEVVAEALLYRGLAVANNNQMEQAVSDLSAAAKDSRTEFGARASFELARLYNQQGSYDKAIAQVQSLMKQGTPHAYWLARAIVVMADSYTAKGDNFQARQYLESLKANYTGSEADIKSMIDERLSKLAN